MTRLIIHIINGKLIIELRIPVIVFHWRENCISHPELVSGSKIHYAVWIGKAQVKLNQVQHDLFGGITVS